MGRTTKPSIIGDGLILPCADWNGHAEKSRGTQVFLYILPWESSYTLVVNSPTRGDASLDVYLLRPGSAFTYCSNIQRTTDQCGVLLEVEWGEKCREHQVERLVPAYHKTNITGLQSFLRGNSHHGQVK